VIISRIRRIHQAIAAQDAANTRQNHRSREAHLLSTLARSLSSNVLCDRFDNLLTDLLATSERVGRGSILAILNGRHIWILACKINLIQAPFV
jgi:hypothetical protein